MVTASRVALKALSKTSSKAVFANRSVSYKRTQKAQTVCEAAQEECEGIYCIPYDLKTVRSLLPFELD